MNTFQLNISAGVGPVEARRFVFLLARRVEYMCFIHGLELLDVAFRGEDDMARSVTLRLRGDVPVAIANLAGSHALVHHVSPRGRAARKRWFAAITLEHVALTPTENISINHNDLEISACRAGGPGGQHVNKVATAVRVRHRPSGLAVRVSSERSQKTNLHTAIKRLEQLLLQQQHQKTSAAHKAMRLVHYRVERGNPVCTYTVNELGELCVETAR